jgi:integrase
VLGQLRQYATAFLQWLGERNTTLASCGQIDVAAWYAENTEHGRTCLRSFLNWAMQSRHCRRSLSIPAMKVARRAALSEDERLDALGRLLTDTEIPIRLRVAGAIVLLYAQPLSRIVRLSVDDVIREGDTVLLQLGKPASPVPAPVAALLLEHIANRDNMNTATNPASRWLFPGRRAGQPSRPDHLSALLNEVGVPTAAARGAAIRQQLLELPAPSSRTPSATTTRPPPGSATRSAELGADTPPATTHGHPQAGLRGKLTAVETGNGVAGQGTA